MIEKVVIKEDPEALFNVKMDGRGYVDEEEGSIDCSVESLLKEACIEEEEVASTDQRISSPLDLFFGKYCCWNPIFFKKAFLLMLYCYGIQDAYSKWGNAQELLMTTTFHPTDDFPGGKFPASAATFSVLFNRAFATLVAAAALIGYNHIREGGGSSLGISFYVFVGVPVAVVGGLARWAQYVSLEYSSIVAQSLFKSSKILIVIILCRLLNKNGGRSRSQYIEGALLTSGVVILSYVANTVSGYDFSLMGVILLFISIILGSFTITWQEWIYRKYGRVNVNVFQMMFGIMVASFAVSLLRNMFSFDGDNLRKALEFVFNQPYWVLVRYLLIIAMYSTIGQIHTLCLMREFGPIVYVTFMVAVRSLLLPGSGKLLLLVHSASAICAVLLIIGVLLYQIRREYIACQTQRRKANATEDPPLFLIITLLVLSVVGLFY